MCGRVFCHTATRSSHTDFEHREVSDVSSSAAANEMLYPLRMSGYRLLEGLCFLLIQVSAVCVYLPDCLKLA